MTIQSSEAALVFLQKKWGNKACPMCGTGQWAVQDNVYQLTEYHSGNVVLGGPIVPVIPVSCANCGNTVLVNAIIAGAVKPDGSQPEAKK